MVKLLSAIATLLMGAGAAHAAGLVEINPDAPPGQQVGDAGGVVAPQPYSAFNAPAIHSERFSHPADPPPAHPPSPPAAPAPQKPPP